MLRALCAIAFTVVVAMPVFGDSIAYSDLGSGGSYDPFISTNITGPNNSEGVLDQSIADLFNASVGGALSQIDVALYWRGGTNSAVISIYTDENNNLGALLFKGTVFNLPAFAPMTTTLATITPSYGSLVSGNNYSLVVDPGAADSAEGWFWNSTGALGTTLVSHGSGFGLSLPFLDAFDVKVNATPVPEPPAWLMSGVAVLFLTCTARWRLLRH
jgi:hypothetical protein